MTHASFVRSGIDRTCQFTCERCQRACWTIAGRTHEGKPGSSTTTAWGRCRWTWAGLGGFRPAHKTVGKPAGGCAHVVARSADTDSGRHTVGRSSLDARGDDRSDGHAGPGRRRPVRRRWQRHRLREQQARLARERVGHRRRRGRRHPGLRHRHQRQRRAPIDFKVDTDRPRTRSTSTGPATTAATGRARSRRSPRRRPCRRRSRTASPTQATELYDCGNWAVSASWDVPVDRRLRRVRRQADPRRTTATPATSPSSCATTPPRPPCSSRPPTRPGRPTTPTAARTSTRAPPTAGPTRSATTAPSPPGGPGRAATSTSAPSTPRSGSWSATGTTSATPAGVDTDRRGALIKNHKIVHVRGPRRVLERRAAGQRRGGPRRRRQPDVPQRERGLLAHPLRAVRRRQPHRYRTLVSYKETWANAKIDPATEWTGTWRDPRFAPPGAARASPRTPSPARCTWSNDSDLAGHGLGRGGQAPSVAQHQPGVSGRRH